jgi:branched-chain amino acid transport system substrate-binding protein
MPAVLRAHGSPLKVGVLLPRSGLQAGLGQDCQRGVDIAPGILQTLDLPQLAIMNGDTESNVETLTRAQNSWSATARSSW